MCGCVCVCVGMGVYAFYRAITIINIRDESSTYIIHVQTLLSDYLNKCLLDLAASFHLDCTLLHELLQLSVEYRCYIRTVLLYPPLLCYQGRLGHNHLWEMKEDHSLLMCVCEEERGKEKEEREDIYREKNYVENASILSS